MAKACNLWKNPFRTPFLVAILSIEKGKIPGHFQDIQGLISVKFQTIMKPYPHAT
jgi:hypothetical protein